MRDDDPDARPKAPVRHEIGQDLAALSLHELHDRVALLLAEVERLRAEASRKTASRGLAESVFRL